MRVNEYSYFLGLIVLMASSLPVVGKTDHDHISGKFLAFAPNAGGQKAYAIAYESSDREFFGFANESLSTGSTDLLGAGMSFRFSICGDDCFWKFYTQLGGGLSTGGPFAEVLWGAMIPILPIWLPTPAPRFIPAIRIDFANQFFVSRYRAITWSYPLWIGLAVPF